MMPEARFHPGDRVWVRDEERLGHIRTPHYIRGKTGQIETIHGVFRNPESLAYGGDGLPQRPLYLVGFMQADVWERRYRGAPSDKLYVDIYEHWLEPAATRGHSDAATGRDGQEARAGG